MKTITGAWAEQDRFFMDEIGGPAGLEAFKAEADLAKAAPCPFCGGAAAARLGKALTALYVQITCDGCGVNTGALLTGRMASGDSYTASDRLRQALATWNRRTAPPEGDQSGDRGQV